MKDRRLYLDLWNELSAEKAMVFLSGPRQAGKTTLARRIAEQFPNHVLFNWDVDENKRLLMNNPSFFQHMERRDASLPLVVLDEIHKYRGWKNYLKGIYDQYSDAYRFLVLGSGRLDIYQKGGDSLAGRYFLFSLWPFTLAELADQRIPWEKFKKDPLSMPPASALLRARWGELERFSGFPEPFLAGKQTFFERWSRAYNRQLIREDIRDATQIKYLDDVDNLFSILPTKVGAPLSVESLGRDLQVAPKNIHHWLDVLERFYLIFRLSPWTRKIARAILKEKKLYLYNPALLTEPAARFENMVALELRRAVSTWNDRGWGDFGLFYLRNKEKEEVDFLIVNHKKPWFMVEAKLTDDSLSKNLSKFQAALAVPAIQLVNRDGIYRLFKNRDQPALIASATRWLSGLP